MSAKDRIYRTLVVAHWISCLSRMVLHFAEACAAKVGEAQSSGDAGGHLHLLAENGEDARRL